MTDSSPDDGPILGIDLGTTNSLAALVGKDGPRILTRADGEALIPSVVSFLDDGKYVVGREARAMAITNPERTVHSVKRLMGQNVDEVADEIRRLAYEVTSGPDSQLAQVAIGGKLRTPQEISALILGEVRAVAESALGVPVNRAVITVPAYFDDSQRQATSKVPPPRS